MGCKWRNNRHLNHSLYGLCRWKISFSHMWKKSLDQPEQSQVYSAPADLERRGIVLLMWKQRRRPTGQVLCSWFYSLFSYLRKSGFLMTWLICLWLGSGYGLIYCHRSLFLIKKLYSLIKKLYSPHSYLLFSILI